MAMTFHNNERLLIALNRALDDNGGAPCEQVPHIFYPEDEPNWQNRMQETRLAKTICSTCPVLKECFSYGVTSHQEYGIWGGTSAEDRRDMKSKRRKYKTSD